ncbi:hypothetical protein FACS189446_0430 [Bacteroidia bacterium]|nr:hypothetical protein FACS189446_0430 [Bacteroidia bacterium]
MKNLVLMITVLFTITGTSAFSQTNSWSLTGNAGTGASDFLGTTDSKPLIFKVNNAVAGLIDVVEDYGGKNNVALGHLSLEYLTNNLFSPGTGNSNTAIGAQALRTTTSGSGNIAIGRWAHEYNTTGSNNVSIGLGVMSRAGNALTGNVAVGYLSLMHNQANLNTAVGNETARDNTGGNWLTAIGAYALKVNTTGSYNTAIGVQSLENNTTGEANTGLGFGTLHDNTTGVWNTAGGTSALWSNKTGQANVAFGGEALAGNIDGNHNTAVGTRALWSHTNVTGESFGHGQDNTAVGYEALREITAGSGNVATGMHALRVNNSGSFNTAIGYYANSYAEAYSNTTSIGYDVRATASDQVRIGNTAVTSIGGQVGWSNLSDKRTGINVRADVPGLAFINRLQPVTYNLDRTAIGNMLNEGISGSAQSPVLDAKAKSVQQERLYTGFIAQDVEESAKSIGYDFSGIDVDEKGIYALRYAEFTVPLVKAVQELSARNESLEAVVVSLQGQVATLTELVNQLGGNRISLPGTHSSASLQQNFPNPFNQVTTIHYVLPPAFRSAKIIVTDVSGNEVKQQPVSGLGAGSITIEAGYLREGIYNYSLYVDERLVETRRMMVTKF